MACTCFDPYCIFFEEKQLMIKEVIFKPNNDFCIHQLFLLEDDRLKIETCRLSIWISGNKRMLSVALVYSFYCTVWNESVWGYVRFLFRRKGLHNKIIIIIIIIIIITIITTTTTIIIIIIIIIREIWKYLHCTVAHYCRTSYYWRPNENRQHRILRALVQPGFIVRQLSSEPCADTLTILT
jgi:fatty acid desaturase